MPARAPTIAVVTDSLFSAVETLIESDCIARLPRSVLEHPLVVGRLAPINLAEPPHSARVAMVRKPGRPMTREAQTLAAMLAPCARASMGLGRNARLPTNHGTYSWRICMTRTSRSRMTDD